MHLQTGHSDLQSPVDRYTWLSLLASYSRVPVFSVVASAIWNSLPDIVVNADSLILLGNIAEKRFRLLLVCYRRYSYCSLVCLSVAFVHCAQTAEDIDTSIQQPHVLPYHVNLSCIGQPLPPQILSQSDPHLLISASETSDGKLWPNDYR